MTSFYRFPAVFIHDDWLNLHQAAKVVSEAAESLDACVAVDMTDFCSTIRWNAKRKAYGMELMDVIHATETAIRMEFSDEEVEQLRDAVEEKNRIRGYYGEVSTDD